MSRASPQMRHFAKRLIEANGSASVNPHSPAEFNVCEKLRPSLAALMGKGGYTALLARSLALAATEAPWLRAAHVNPDGSLGGLEEAIGQAPRDKFVEGKVILLAQLLGLLVAFIGENLTVGLAREAWPNASIDSLELVNGGNHEKEK